MKKNLIIVAHPDDETIWMGGTILKNQRCQWTIISMCRKNDKDRKPKFLKVCKRYNATPLISNLDDEKLNDLSTEKVATKIKKVLPKREYDFIYTHGKNGEYGHKRHKEVHRAIKRLITNKELKCKKLFYFSYKQGTKKIKNNPELQVAIPDERADIHTNLSKDNFKKKKMLVRNIYGFTRDSFEVLSCNKKEAFNKGK